MKNKKMKTILLTVLILIVFECPVIALPPDPDNAALLYHQAFLVYERPDDTMRDMVGDLAKGRIEPNPTITKYIESCRPAIELAAAASELDECDWGLKYSDGFDLQARHLAEAKMLTYIILADARTVAAQGDYNLAIERCLTARKLAIHIGQAPIAISFIIEKAFERTANKCIQDILSSDTVELETLQDLKSQLDELDGRCKPIEFFLEAEQEVMVMYITPEKIQEVLPWIESGDTRSCEGAWELILNADMQFCQRNLAYFNEYWPRVFSALKLSYEPAYKELKGLEKKYLEGHKDCKENPDATMTIILGPAVYEMYSRGIESRTFGNAIKTAIEIYIITGRTGQLPDSLPTGSPKDLYSGKDFEYEKTVEGFILRCQGKDLNKDEICEYEFKTPK